MHVLRRPIEITAQNYRSRWPRTLRRSFPEADIDTLLQHC
jgi:hypothetical protein